MATQKIQTGDRVKVISGKFKGTLGIVTNVRAKIKKGKLSKRVSLTGVPKITKFFKGVNNGSNSLPGERYDVDRTINISNVQVVDDKEKVTKTKVERTDKGVQRIAKTTKMPITKHSTTLEEKPTKELKNKKK